MADPNTAKRLSKAAFILATIDFRRRMEGDPGVGSSIERMIIDRELRELEDEISRDPGALAGRLHIGVVQRRRSDDSHVKR